VVVIAPWLPSALRRTAIAQFFRNPRPLAINRPAKSGSLEDCVLDVRSRALVQKQSDDGWLVGCDRLMERCGVRVKSVGIVSVRIFTRVQQHSDHLRV